MGKIVMPKNSAMLEEIQAVLKIYYEAKTWLANDEYVRKLKAIIGSEQYPSSYTKKAQITSYFGFTEWEDISDSSSLRRITASGQRFYEALLNNDIEKIHAELMYSLEHITFGRNNFGVPDSDSDVEPPVVFIRAILDLGYLTYKEFGFLLWTLEDCGGNYTDAIKYIKEQRVKASFDIEQEAQKYTDAKPIMYLIRYDFLKEAETKDRNKHIVISPSVLNKYEVRLRNLKIYNVDKNIIVDEQEEHQVGNIFELIKKKYQSKDYPYIDEELRNGLYFDFNKLYGINALMSLTGKELLYRIFGTKAQDSQSLMYEVEHGKKYSAFGSCRGAYGWANVLICFKGEQWQYCTSASNITNITEEVAIEKAEALVDDLVLGLELIDEYKQSGKLDSIEGYVELDEELKKVLGELYNKPRFKKHLTLLYPDIFMNMYDNILKTDGWLNQIFTILGLELTGNWYTQSGRFSLLAKELEIPNLDLYLIVKSLLEESGELPGENDEEDGVMLDYKENENRFRNWMSTQFSASGALCTPSMISNNARALNKAPKLVDITEYPDLESIFQITNVDTYSDVKSIIYSATNFDEANKACGNGFLSSALKWYTKYLDEISVVPENEVVEEYEDYNKEKFINDVFMSDKEYDRIVRLLKHKKNIILQGAPGVGKTFLAKRLAYSIIGKKNHNRVEMIQFHQNYGYEDFIMGYKPTEDHFDLVMGIFYQFCKKASQGEGDFFFIIDEINRGNLSKIFGELLMLIENDKRGDEYKVKLAYKNEYFSVPKNVYIIGMMNTADRSLAMMDYALRRRFTFIDICPAFGKPQFIAYLKKLHLSVPMVDKINERFKALNEKISDENSSGLGKGYCIGHSYFCTELSAGQNEDEWYSDIIDFEIEPLLNEYWWDDKNKAEECIKELKK